MTTLASFAKSAGVELITCDKSWGGTIGYKEKDYPSCAICGFRTENAAYKSWLKSTFGDHTAKAVLKLIKKASTL